MTNNIECRKYIINIDPIFSDLAKKVSILVFLHINISKSTVTFKSLFNI